MLIVNDRVGFDEYDIGGKTLIRLTEKGKLTVEDVRLGSKHCVQALNARQNITHLLIDMWELKNLPANIIKMIIYTRPLYQHPNLGMVIVVCKPGHVAAFAQAIADMLPLESRFYLCTSYEDAAVTINRPLS